LKTTEERAVAWNAERSTPEAFPTKGPEASPKPSTAGGGTIAGDESVTIAPTSIEGLDLVKAIALAAAVEAMASGHARVLAGELRAMLENAQGASAEVLSLAAVRPRGKK
jgi:hypothetical protein